MTMKSVRSFAHTTHSFACSVKLASLARSAALIHSLALLLTLSGAHGQELHVYELNASISTHSGTVSLPVHRTISCLSMWLSSRCFSRSGFASIKMKRPTAKKAGWQWQFLVLRGFLGSFPLVDILESAVPLEQFDCLRAIGKKLSLKGAST